MVGNIALVKDHRLSIWVPYMAFLVQNTVCNTSVCVCVCVCVCKRERKTNRKNFLWFKKEVVEIVAFFVEHSQREN
jgi:hypothetical protein